MERSGLGKTFKFTCQTIYTNNFLHDKFFYDKDTSSKADMVAFEQVYLSYKNCYMVLSKRANKNCHRKDYHRKLLV